MISTVTTGGRRVGFSSQSGSMAAVFRERVPHGDKILACSPFFPPISAHSAPPMSAARSLPSVPFPRLTPAHHQALRARLRAVVRNASPAEPSLEKTGADRGGEIGPFWELEPTPLVLPAGEWAQLEAGLRQRARLVNAFLFDAYGGQLVLREGLLPPEIVLNDPYYRRACLELEPERKFPAMLLCFDLIKTAAGWQVTGTHTNSPTGLGIAVQNRRFLSHEAGEIYRTLPDHHSIINFPLRLLDALKQLAPRTATDRA